MRLIGFLLSIQGIALFTNGIISVMRDRPVIFLENELHPLISYLYFPIGVLFLVIGIGILKDKMRSSLLFFRFSIGVLGAWLLYSVGMGGYALVQSFSLGLLIILTIQCVIQLVFIIAILSFRNFNVTKN